MGVETNGRPQKFKDEKTLKLIEDLASIQCTNREIANLIGVDETTLGKNKVYAERIEKGKDRGKTNLRRAMFRSALGGNATMQIWLSKQLLGYKEKIMSEENKNTVLTLRYNLPEGINSEERKSN